MTAEQLIPALKVQIDLMTDPKEKNKVHNWILGVMESNEQRKERLNGLLDSKERYTIKKNKRENKKAPSKQLKGLEN